MRRNYETEFASKIILNSYLYDETQEVAKRAACTPDFFYMTVKTD
jgi:hypothetical protein